MIDTRTLCGNWVEQLNVQESLQMLLHELLLTWWLFCLNNHNGWTFATHLLLKEVYNAHFRGKGQAKEQKSRSTKTLLLAELEKGIYKNLLYMIAIGQLCVVKLKRLNPCTWTLKFSWTYKVPHPPTTIIYTKQVQFQLNCGRKPQLR